MQKVREPSEMQYLTNSQFVVIPDCGHMLNMEQPDTFNKAVLQFIDDD